MARKKLKGRTVTAAEMAKLEAALSALSGVRGLIGEDVQPFDEETGEPGVDHPNHDALLALGEATDAIADVLYPEQG